MVGIDVDAPVGQRYSSEGDLKSGDSFNRGASKIICNTLLEGKQVIGIDVASENNGSSLVIFPDDGEIDGGVNESRDIKGHELAGQQHEILATNLASTVRPGGAFASLNGIKGGGGKQVKVSKKLVKERACWVFVFSVVPTDVRGNDGPDGAISINASEHTSALSV